MKKILAFLLVSIMLINLVGCGQTNDASVSELDNTSNTSNTTNTSDGDIYTAIPFLEQYKEYKYDGEIDVLYLVCTTAAEYFTDSYAVWEPMMKEKGINIELVGPPEYSDASLISTLESALASQRYDIVVLYPITPSAITPHLDNIWENYKVPILSYAFSPETGSGHYYLGTSYYSCGEVMGQSILDYVNSRSEYFDTLDTIPVAVYMNPQGADQYERIRGALDVLKKDGRFSLIEEYAANGEAACLTQTETLLASNPEVEIILTQIDNDVTGAYQAIASGTYKHSEYLSLWGFDATGAVCSLMLKDGRDGVVQGSTYISHNEAGEALIELIPILVGAAKRGELIEFNKEHYDWLGTGLENYYVTVTPENVAEHYKGK